MTPIEKFNAAVNEALYAVRTDKIVHEQRTAEGDFLHRLIVNGDPGPWTSCHAIARHGLWCASTKEAWEGEYPRVFFVIPVCEHETSSPAPVVSSSPAQSDFHPGPGETRGPNTTPAEDTPTSSAGDDGGSCTLLYGDKTWHGGEGWYYHDAEYPEEGSCGRFESWEEAAIHAAMCGYPRPVPSVVEFEKALSAIRQEMRDTRSANLAIQQVRRAQEIELAIARIKLGELKEAARAFIDASYDEGTSPERERLKGMLSDGDSHG